MPFAVTLSGPSDRHYRDLHGGVMPRRAPHGELAAGLGRRDELSLPPTTAASHAGHPHAELAAGLGRCGRGVFAP